MSRLYVQEVDPNHTNRLITLNTPHFGSILGNVYQIYDFAQLFPNVRDNKYVQMFNEKLDSAFSKDHNMQAVKDLGEKSSAIYLNQTYTHGPTTAAAGYSSGSRETYFVVYPHFLLWRTGQQKYYDRVE